MLRAFCLCFNSLSRGVRRDSSLKEGANPLSHLALLDASSPEGGALFVLTGRCKKALPLGELAATIGSRLRGFNHCST